MFGVEHRERTIRNLQKFDRVNENFKFTFAVLRLECAALVVAAHSDCVAGTCSSMRPLAMDSCLLDAFRAEVAAIVATASYPSQCQIQFL